MKIDELLVEYERRRAEAELQGSLAPIAKVYGLVLEELRQVDGRETLARFMTTDEAARVHRVDARTVARWCANGRFPGAEKTSGDAGEWRIPANEVYASLGKRRARRDTPKLWRPP